MLFFLKENINLNFFVQVSLPEYFANFIWPESRKALHVIGTCYVNGCIHRLFYSTLGNLFLHMGSKYWVKGTVSPQNIKFLSI